MTPIQLEFFPGRACPLEAKPATDRWPISTGGGWFPIWSHNRRELFFLSPDRRIMVASYTTNGNSFVPGKPRLWSEKRLLRLPAQSYDLAPDGKRFAVVLAEF